jgi:hypothetical protein
MKPADHLSIANVGASRAIAAHSFGVFSMYHAMFSTFGYNPMHIALAAGCSYQLLTPNHVIN